MCGIYKLKARKIVLLKGETIERLLDWERTIGERAGSKSKHDS